LTSTFEVGSEPLPAAMTGVSSPETAGKLPVPLRSTFAFWSAESSVEQAE